MTGVQSRMAAVLASFVVVTLANQGAQELTPEFQANLEQWFGHTFELALFLGYAFLHPKIQQKTEKG